MAPSSLSELQALKYAELRTLCKSVNIKASGKAEALVASLAQHYGFNDEESAEIPAPAKPAPKKRTTSGSSKSKAPEAPENAAGTRESVKALPVPASQTPAKVQERIVYQTSPGTKATVATLLSTVQDLQSQLTLTRSALTGLESTVAAPRSPALKKSEVVSLMKDKIAEHRQAVTVDLDSRFSALSAQLSQLEEAGASAAQQSEIGQLRTQLIQEYEAAVESAVVKLRSDLTSRLSALEKPASKEVEQALDNLSLPVPAATSGPSPRRKVSFGPDFVFDLDAPPIRSVSFSSPGGSPAPASSSTPRRSSLVNRNKDSQSTPFKATLPVISASSDSATPASSLPSHMLATAASAAKRSPRSPRVSAPAQMQQAPQPMSPAGPPPKAALGKRTRHSDASELSIQVAALDSPAARSRTTSASSTDGVVSPGRGLAFHLAEAAKTDNDQHARKRQRVSAAGPAEEEDQEKEEEEEEEEAMDSDEADTSTSSSEQQEGDDSYISNEAEDNSVRDFLLPTKTGDEEPTALKPLAKAQQSPVSVHDPSFFAGLPVSPSTSSTRRSTLTGSSSKENSVPASSRKSLPASLAVPVVSPYAASKSPSQLASTSTSAFGTPSSISNRRITIGPAASARKATPARATPYSAKKPVPASASAATGAAGPSGRKSFSFMATPPAARTLFGSERLAPSSAASVATSAAQTAWEGDESADEEATARFGDGFASAMTSPQKPGWGRLAAGMFGGAA